MTEQGDPTELLNASQEVAAVLATSADRYALLQTRIADPRFFADVKRQALSVSLLASQAHCSALELVPEFRASLSREQAPPLMALLLLGAIASSCTVIAAAGAPAAIDTVTLLSAKRLQAILASPDVASWLSGSLA